MALNRMILVFKCHNQLFHCFVQNIHFSNLSPEEVVYCFAVTALSAALSKKNGSILLPAQNSTKQWLAVDIWDVEDRSWILSSPHVKILFGWHRHQVRNTLQQRHLIFFEKSPFTSFCCKIHYVNARRCASSSGLKRYVDWIL